MRKVLVIFAVVATMVNGYFAAFTRTNSYCELDVNDVEIPAEAEVDAAFPWGPVLAIVAGTYLYYKSKQTGTIYRCNGTVTDPVDPHYGTVDWECVEKSYTDRITCNPVGKHTYPPSYPDYTINPNDLWL